MLSLMASATGVVIRLVAVTLLALVAVVNLIGFLFLGYGWLMDADVQVKGGPLRLLLGFATLFLCVRGIRALLRPAIRVSS